MLHLLWLVPAVPVAGFVVLVVAGAHLRRSGVSAVGVGSIAIATAIAFSIAIPFLSLPPTARSTSFTRATSGLSR